MQLVSSFTSLYAIGMTDKAYRSYLLGIPKSEYNIFLVDFENEIWNRRYKLAVFRENRRLQKHEFWVRRERMFLEALHILMKRRNIASILFVEKLMNYSKGTATI